MSTIHGVANPSLRSRSNTAHAVSQLALESYYNSDKITDDLQIEDVILRSPSPNPVAERDAGTLSKNEAREEVRSLRKQIQNMVEIKQEKRDHSVLTQEGEDDDVVVAEGSRQRKRARKSHDSAVEVIDLSDD